MKLIVGNWYILDQADKELSEQVMLEKIYPKVEADSFNMMKEISIMRGADWVRVWSDGKSRDVQASRLSKMFPAAKVLIAASILVIIVIVLLTCNNQ